MSTWWAQLTRRSRTPSATTGLGNSPYQSVGARLLVRIMEPVLWRSLTSSKKSSPAWGVNSRRPKSSRISRSTRTSRRILASQVPSAWPSAWARWVLPTPLVIHGLIFEWPLSCRSLGSCDLCNERPAVVASCGSAGLSAVGVNMTSMKLEMMAEEDVELRVRLETDPQMMAELGGPRPREAIERAHAKARGVRMFGQIHAFPAVTNGPSNKICEKNGFTNLGECEVEFAGRGLRCNHWRIDLF